MEGTLPCCLASSNAALVFVAGCDPCPPSRERIILRLERLEEIEAANNLLALISPSMPAGLVGPSSQTYAEPEIAAALSDSDSHPTITESTNPVLADKLFAESTASNEGARADDFASAGVLEEEQEISSSVSLFARQGEESNDLLKSIADDLLSARKNHSSEGGPTGQLGSPNLAGANAAPFGNPFGGSSTQTGSSGGSGNSSGGSGPGANGFSNAVLTAMTSQTALGTVAESNANSPQTSANQGMASPSTAALSVTQATPSTSGPQQSVIPTGVASSLSASSGSQAEAQSLLNNLPWMFEANVGQFDAQTQFMARGSAFDVALSATQAQFLLTSGSPASDPTDSAAAATSDAAPTTSVISMQLVGANPNAVASGVNELPTKTNYFAGDDPSQWRTNVANYASAQFRDVYNGIDVVYYANSQNDLEHNFIVAPGSDPSQIVTQISGAKEIALDAQGNLVIQTATGNLVEHAPVAYQDVNGSQQAVSSHFVLLANNEVGISVGPYDHSQPLVIDPNWEYSSYLGGPGTDEGRGIAVSPAGFAEVVGTTTATWNPGGGATVTSIKPGNGGGDNVFVVGIESGGTTVRYITYLMGSGNDDGNAIATDTAGNVYITGQTTSMDFPTKLPWQANLVGSSDAFVAKLDGTGANLVFSTYLGGDGDEEGLGIAVDATTNHNIDVVGSTSTTTFGSGNNTIDARVFGSRGVPEAKFAFVCQLSNAGTPQDLIVMEGGDGATATGVDVDQNGYAYVTGWTVAPTDKVSFFETTMGAFQTTSAGSDDAFVVKIAWVPNGRVQNLTYSTYFGGKGATKSNGIVVDQSDDSVYIVGQTDAPSPFGVANKLAYTLIGSSTKQALSAFVAHFSPKLDPTVNPYFVVLAGNNDDSGKGIALTTKIDGKTKLYITGFTDSNNKGDGFPTPSTLQPFRGTVQEPYDGFLALLDPSKAPANSLLFNTYVGGTGSESGRGVAVDGDGDAYITGDTNSGNFRPPLKPPIPGFQTIYGGGRRDAFVVEIAPNLAAAGPPRMGALNNNQLDYVDTKLTFTAMAETFDGSSPNYSLSEAPDGASIDPSSGVFTWTPTPSQIGTWTFYVDASDAEDAFDEQAITVSVIPQLTFMGVNSSSSFAPPGQPVTFTATLMPEGGSGNPLPTGLVTFEDGTNVLGTGSLIAGNQNAQATFTTSTLASGSHTIVAIYGGDSVYGQSSGSVAQTIGQSTTPTTTTFLSMSTGQPTYGQAITLTATVSGGNGPPTGSVVFEDGLTVIGTAPVVLVGNSYQASLTTSTLAWGPHAITAVYSGDGNGSPSSASSSMVVLQGSTSTTLTSSANPAPYGQAVTFTATVVPTVGTGTPTGTITFFDADDETELGTVPLTGSNGSAQATFTMSALDYGDYKILAAYSGDNNFSGSHSDSLDQSVG